MAAVIIQFDDLGVGRQTVDTDEPRTRFAVDAMVSAVARFRDLTRPVPLHQTRDRVHLEAQAVATFGM